MPSSSRERNAGRCGHTANRRRVTTSRARLLSINTPQASIFIDQARAKWPETRADWSGAGRRWGNSMTNQLPVREREREERTRERTTREKTRKKRESSGVGHAHKGGREQQPPARRRRNRRGYPMRSAHIEPPCDADKLFFSPLRGTRSGTRATGPDTADRHVAILTSSSNV